MDVSLELLETFYVLNVMFAFAFHTFFIVSFYFRATYMESEVLSFVC